jgi:hypothetical protein
MRSYLLYHIRVGVGNVGELSSGSAVFGAHVESMRRLVLFEFAPALPHGQQRAGSRQRDTGKKLEGRQV